MKNTQECRVQRDPVNNPLLSLPEQERKRADSTDATSAASYFVCPPTENKTGLPLTQETISMLYGKDRREGEGD